MLRRGAPIANEERCLGTRCRHMPMRQAAQQLQSRRLTCARRLSAKQPPQRFDLGRRPVRGLDTVRFLTLPPSR